MTVKKKIIDINTLNLGLLNLDHSCNTLISLKYFYETCDDLFN
jgi:hypothetical protein